MHIQKGTDYLTEGADYTTYGIDVGDHANQIEVYGNPHLRDHVLRLLAKSPPVTYTVTVEGSPHGPIMSKDIEITAWTCLEAFEKGQKEAELLYGPTGMVRVVKLEWPK